MTNKTQVKSSILAAVHETASDLHRQGFINKRTMGRYDALCLKPIPACNSEDIRTMREKLKLSQAVLASIATDRKACH
ncbi:hypothetical protein LSG25_14285 [Paralcaligenes sp. KSB-10]|uniref:hypothetical protein n=1 Tax=Paralcaligenes sp. KSB-10 TaxID=2901142 RepID=UPI001E48CC7D|nr:hypothetical protein [Paralcaligenes sp. KSB-10]UHL63220.1 hypothetical protein LSG25_14285 [Paralcaligenes sp. KSB-10]